MKVVSIIFFLIVLALHVNAEESDSIFARANNYYSEAKYEEAIDLYLKLDSMGYASPDLYYNAANAFFRSNKLGKARLYYERASLLDPGDEDIRANLTYTESLLSDRFEEVPVLFFVRWYQNLLNIFSSNTWAIISLSLFGISLAAFLVYVFVSRQLIKRTGFYTGIIALILSALSLVFAIQQNRLKDAAIVMAPSITVKSAPRNSGKDLFVLHEGSKVWVLSELEGWKEIRISDGRIGWIPSGEIERI